MRRRIAVSLAVVALSAAGTGAALATGPDPGGPAKHGLCQAYSSGSSNGQANKQGAPPFQNLQNAAGSNGVAQYCSNATPGGK